MTNKDIDIDINSGRFSGFGCLCLALAIVTLWVGCSVAQRLEQGKPIIVIEHVDK